MTAFFAAAAAGCGIPSTDAVTAGPPASGIQQPGAETPSVLLYFAGPNGIRAVSRPVDRPPSPQQALELLLKGPSPAERGRGLTSQVPPMGGRLTATTADGAVDLLVPVTIASGALDVTAVSQLACTAAHADVPGGKPPTQVDIRIHENNLRSPKPWTVRCGPNGNVTLAPT
ncbi:GerMN domain-containing protein [Streptomyces sp. MST-110588]|nr:GerMN domain-containing protein [Streptomyces sp. MST-110588]